MTGIFEKNPQFETGWPALQSQSLAGNCCLWQEVGLFVASRYCLPLASLNWIIAKATVIVEQMGRDSSGCDRASGTDVINPELQLNISNFPPFLRSR